MAFSRVALSFRHGDLCSVSCDVGSWRLCRYYIAKVRSSVFILVFYSELVTNQDRNLAVLTVFKCYFIMHINYFNGLIIALLIIL